MKILLAFDSFKGCLTAKEACRCGAQAIREILPEARVVECPLSDGGEGLVDCVARLLPTRQICLTAHGPLMQPVETSYLIAEDGDTAYMEMAATSGLTLIPPEKRNPMLTTTYGVGEMIVDATRQGVRHIVMGIGGSATCDGGQGMLDALDDAGLRTVDVPRINVACDVTNPLYGDQGAARIFAPQKGATPQQVELLDMRLRRFARQAEEAHLATPDLAQQPGAGAAGGLGYGLVAYLGAALRSGIDTILDITSFDVLLQDADVVITGEGKSDAQTLMGKVPHGVLRRARKIRGRSGHILVALLSGGIEDKEGKLRTAFDVVKSINENDDRPLDALMHPQTAMENLATTVRNLCRSTVLSDF